MNGQINDQVAGDRLLTLLTSHAAEINANWMSALTERWSSESDKRQQTLSQERVEQEDLFSLLLQVLAAGESGGRGLKAKIASKPVDDLLAEVSLLEKSAEDVLSRTGDVSDRDELDQIGQVLRETVAQVVREIMFTKIKTYEQIVEHGQRGFCLVDKDGQIIHANKEMEELIGPGELDGKYLPKFFCKDDRNSIRQAFVEKQPPVQLQVTNQQGRAIPVGVEIGPLYLEGEHQGAYACLIGLKERQRAEEEIYNKFPEGIIKWKMPAPEISYEKATILYANAKATEMAGYKSLVGKKLEVLFPDEKNLTKLREQIAKRQQGEGDEYELDMTCADGKKQIPILVSSVPEMDLQAKKIVGAVTIIRNLERQKAIAAMHDAIETHRSSEAILAAVAQILATVLKFDYFQVVIYSSDLRYIRRLYPGPDIEPKWQVRWWQPSNRDLSERLVEYVKAHQDPEVVDIKTLFGGDLRKLKDDEFFKSFPEFQSLIRFPINMGEKTVASISISHKDEGIYTDEDSELLILLPIDKAVLLSLYYEDKKNLEFRLNLLNDMTVNCHDIPTVHQVILDNLSNHYKWESVALFEVEEAADEIRLLKQKPSDPSWSLPDNLTLKLSGKGIVAYAAREKKTVNIPDVDADPIAREHYLPGFKKTKSEFCLFIKSGFGCWILNIEDSRKYAFSPEEEKALQEDILPELEELLERLSEHFIATNIRNSTSDMVIVTDNFNLIKSVNPATEKKLGFAQSELIKTHFKDLFADPESYTEAVKSQNTIDSKEATFKNKSGHDLKVLLSGSSFPKGINGKFYLAKDITLYDREQEIKNLNNLLDALAVQSRTSLSLVFSWLNSLTGTAPDIVDKIRRQLHKVEMTFDRFALYSSSKELPTEKLLLEVSEILENLEEQFPLSEFKKITIEPYPPKIVLRADPFQIVFCLQSILSYLIRYVPEDEKIRISIVPEKDIMKFEIVGFWPEAKLDKHLYRTMFELALGEKTILQFMANHNGLFKYYPVNSKITFVLKLPVVTGEDYANL